MEQGLPKSVQAQLDQAEAIEKQLAAAASEASGNTEQPPETTPPVQEEVKTEPTTVAPTAVPADPEWKQRYDILQGKYNAEVPRLHDQLKTQTNTLQSMQHEIEDLKTKPIEPQIARASLVTKDDEETFGADLVDMNRRVSRDEISPVALKVAALEKELSKLMQLQQKVNTVEKQQVETAQERFWVALKDTVPDWETINGDQRWLDWLAEYDAVAGKTRQESLDEAGSHLDARRISAMFTTWKSLYPPSEDRKAQTRQELSRQVAPTKQSSSSAQPASEKIWTLAEYERAFDPRLRQAMSDTEIDALQADADRALAEGRIK